MMVTTMAVDVRLSLGTVGAPTRPPTIRCSLFFIVETMVLAMLLHVCFVKIHGVPLQCYWGTVGGDNIGVMFRCLRVVLLSLHSVD